MDKPALIGIARRRWYLLVLGVLASAVLGFGASVSSPPTYTARALVMLLPSQTTVGDDGNPFLELSGLELPARVVVASLSSTSVRDKFGDQFPDVGYAVTIEESTRGPIVAIDVSGSSDDTTLAALPPLIQEAITTLERLQNEVGTPPEATVRAMVLTQDETATADRGGTVRLVIAAVALGLVATVLLASAIDGRSRQRRVRAIAAESGAVAPEDPPQDDPTGLPDRAGGVQPEDAEPNGSDPVDPEPQPASRPVAGSPAQRGRTGRPRSGKARSRKPH
ncbi:hypothetical protein [Nocardioides pinisoli]|uniref:Polysaccharide chain length determinant N-terminal domain-containing protein n=1 Tax=Nocardioides pinisoli TaxID=2950279 RepID=A0ABT1L197_9ACTN|nr:hypothetical protein [Nocardioides pinisoli]MCP3423038.1 hypothetical protein [Nocardioides pinisoli]